MAERTEEKLFDRLLAFSGQERQNEKAAQEKSLREAKNRIVLIEDASKQLFEEKIAGNVPDSMFNKLFADYERELFVLEDTAHSLRQALSDGNESDVKAWLELSRNVFPLTALTEPRPFSLSTMWWYMRV